MGPFLLSHPWLRQGAAFSRMKASPVSSTYHGCLYSVDDVFLCTSSHSLCEEQAAKGLRNEGLLRVLTVSALSFRVPQITACSLPRYSAGVGGEAGVGVPGCPTPRRHARAKSRPDTQGPGTPPAACSSDEDKAGCPPRVVVSTLRGNERPRPPLGTAHRPGPGLTAILSPPGAPVPSLVSFSVGLTRKPFPSDAGVVLFNKVLVNDGDVYDPSTGESACAQLLRRASRCPFLSQNPLTLLGRVCMGSSPQNGRPTLSLGCCPLGCGCLTCERPDPLVPTVPQPTDTSRQGAGAVTGRVHAVAGAVCGSWFWAEAGAATRAPGFSIRALLGAHGRLPGLPCSPCPGCGDNVHVSGTLGTQRWGPPVLPRAQMPRTSLGRGS